MRALIANTESSDRAIAKGLGVDHKTVGKYRRELEAGGEIPRLEIRRGFNGKPCKAAPAPPKPGEVDDLGQAVPERLRPAFETAPEFKKLAGELTEIKRRLFQLKRASVFVRRREDEWREKFDFLIGAIATSTPKEVHQDCGGKGCPQCVKTGYITEDSGGD